MKKAFTHICSLIFIFVFLVIIESCKNANLKSYTTAIAPIENEKPLVKKDLQFLYDASDLSTYNIQLANEALIRSTATETTALAESIITSSAKIKNAIATVAAKYNINLPLDITTEQKRNWKQLVKQRGWNFDKTFAAIVEVNLKSADDLFASAAKDSNDRSLKEVATKGLIAQESLKEFSIAQQNKIKERTGIIDEPANANGAVAELLKVKTK